MITQNNKLIKIQEQLKSVGREQPLCLTHCEICGHLVNLMAMTLNRGEYLLLIGNGNPKRFLQEYKNCWQIEELFACLKSRGFNFEDTPLTTPDKIAKIMAILTLAFLWATKTGQWLHQRKAIQQKKTLQRPVIVFQFLIRFKYDFDTMINAIIFLKQIPQVPLDKSPIFLNWI